MKRRIKILAGCTVLFLLGVGLGYLLSVPGPASGVGRYQESPDGKWVASAETLDEGSVLGPHRTYSWLTIQTPPPYHSRGTVRSLRIEDSAVPPIDWRNEGHILWATNSSTVTFKCDARQTTMEITLKSMP
jgi:hypothetical protein